MLGKCLGATSLSIKMGGKVRLVSVVSPDRSLELGSY